MKYFILLLALACSQGHLGVEKISVKKVSDFRLLDHHGQAHSLYYYRNSKGIVLQWQKNTCDKTKLKESESLLSSYRVKGIIPFFINANSSEGLAELSDFARKNQIEIPILKDDVQSVTKNFEIKNTGEAVIIDPKNWKVIYKGFLNKKVLEQYLNGDEILTAGKKAEACPIDLAPSESKMTYVKDVAPILKSRCLSCHHPQGAAPWAMSDYEKVKGWTPMIKEVLLLKRMPPWLVDPRYDHFKTNLRLETGEAKKILSWIDQGSPRGEGIDPLKGLSDITQSDWSLGKPDLIIPLGKIKIPPRGKIPYFDLRISNPLKEPRWIRAVQFKPGNSRVLHHASVMYGSIIQDNDSDRLVSSLDSRPMTQFYSLASYVPGISHWEYPQKSGKLLRPHQEFYFELHYVPTGKDETDTPELGIYFHKNKPSRIFHVEHSSKLNFTIPPNESDYKLRGEDLLIHKDIDLHTLTCHMHYRGKSMRISAKYPNGTSEILLSVPRYNFNWQHRYILKEPKFIPKGSIISAQAAFDNSKMNPFNPDPSKEVSQGRDTENEMLYFVIGFTEKGILKQ